MRDFVLIAVSVACGALGVLNWSLSGENAALREQLDAKSTASEGSSKTSSSEKNPISERKKKADTLERTREALQRKGGTSPKLSVEERRAMLEERKAAARSKTGVGSDQDKGLSVKSYEDRMSEQISTQVAQMSESESWDEETTAEVEDIIADTLSYRKELQESFRAGDITRDELIESIKEDKVSREEDLLELVGAEGPKLMRNALRPTKPSSTRPNLPVRSGKPSMRPSAPTSSE